MVAAENTEKAAAAAKTVVAAEKIEEAAAVAAKTVAVAEKTVVTTEKTATETTAQSASKPTLAPAVVTPVAVKQAVEVVKRFTKSHNTQLCPGGQPSQ